MAAKLVAHRAAQEIRITGADAFFVELAEKVRSLEELRSSHPLTAPVAVATLKRYIAEDRYRVRLEDLVRDEADRVAGRLQAELPVQGGATPTGETGAARLRRMDAVTETLRHLFFHGCRLAAPAQHDVVLRSLQLLQPRGNNNGGWKFYIEMAHYPMATVVYAGALGALANRNWDLLRQLLSLRFSEREKQQVVCNRLMICRAAPDEAAQTLHDQKFHTPLSVHLAALLSPMAAGIVPDPENLFDEVEIMLALCYLDLCRDLNTDHIWMPPGRYCWRGSFSGGGVAARLLAEAELEGTGWAPLQAGWFSGKQERLLVVKKAFQETLQSFASSL
jgi:hypothetical protein